MATLKGIAIIGWGSLIWDLESLAPQTKGDWEMGVGPELAMEFARVSPKRKLALAVCLEPMHGAPCRTNVIASTRTNIHDAVADLAVRERAPVERVGAICARSGHVSGSNREITGAVSDWCARTGWDGAVWTDLEPNFEEHLGDAFSVQRAITYLKGLRSESREEAVRYIELAPAATDTPLRRALGAEEWWLEDARRLGLRSG
ncbi:MAG: hypothetical protein AAGE80_14055 [Pseudomonadota bacterium]